MPYAARFRPQAGGRSAGGCKRLQEAAAAGWLQEAGANVGNAGWRKCGCGRLQEAASGRSRQQAEARGDTAINGCSPKGDTAINGVIPERDTAINGETQLSMDVAPNETLLSTS